MEEALRWTDAEETGRPRGSVSLEKKASSQLSPCQASRREKVYRPGLGSEQRPGAAPEAAVSPSRAAIPLPGLSSSCSGGSGTRS